MNTIKKFEISVDFWGYESEAELTELITKMKSHIGGGIYGSGGSYRVIRIGKEIRGEENGK